MTDCTGREIDVQLHLAKKTGGTAIKELGPLSDRASHLTLTLAVGECSSTFIRTPLCVMQTKVPLRYGSKLIKTSPLRPSTTHLLIFTSFPIFSYRFWSDFVLHRQLATSTVVGR